MEAEKPSILIPYPYSKNNHQEKNAMILAASGGSVLINQNNMSKEVFEETLERIFKIKSKKGKKHYEILDLMKKNCLLYTSPSPRDMRRSRMPSSA